MTLAQSPHSKSRFPDLLAILQDGIFGKSVSSIVIAYGLLACNMCFLYEVESAAGFTRSNRSVASLLPILTSLAYAVFVTIEAAAVKMTTAKAAVPVVLTVIRVLSLAASAILVFPLFVVSRLFGFLESRNTARLKAVTTVASNSAVLDGELLQPLLNRGATFLAELNRVPVESQLAIGLKNAPETLACCLLYEYYQACSQSRKDRLQEKAKSYTNATSLLAPFTHQFEGQSKVDVAKTRTVWLFTLRAENLRRVIVSAEERGQSLSVRDRDQLLYHFNTFLRYAWDCVEQEPLSRKLVLQIEESLEARLRDLHVNVPAKKPIDGADSWELIADL